MRTQVAVIGAGPAGLLLAHLLHKAGVEAVVIDRKNRVYIEARVRAGVVEQGTADLLAHIGVDKRFKREGLVHHGTKLVNDGRMFHVSFTQLTGGRHVTVYGQQEVMKDLFDAAESRGIPIVFGAEGVELHGLESDKPVRDLAGERRRSADPVRLRRWL